MATYQNLNQFKPTSLLGGLSFVNNPNVKSVKIDPASTATKLQAGTPVKLVDKTSSEVLVDACSAATDPVYGVIIFNAKKGTYSAGQTVEIACKGTVIFLESSAAIARGARVSSAVTPTAPTVVTNTTSTNARVGQCLDKCAAANVLVRIEVDPDIVP